MTACVNKKHTRRVALAISASLVGALSLGAAAPVFAEGVETLALDEAAIGNATVAYRNGESGATFTYNGRRQGLIPSTMTPKGGSDTQRLQLQTSADIESGYYYFYVNMDAAQDQMSGSNFDNVQYENADGIMTDLAGRVMYTMPEEIGNYAVVSGYFDATTRTWNCVDLAATFKIAPQSLDGAVLFEGNDMSDTEFAFSGFGGTNTGAALAQEMNVALDGVRLTKGDDYTLTVIDPATGAEATTLYADTTYRAHIVGASGSAYEGQVADIEFTYGKCDLSELDIVGKVEQTTAPQTPYTLTSLTDLVDGQDPAGFWFDGTQVGIDFVSGPNGGVNDWTAGRYTFTIKASADSDWFTGEKSFDYINANQEATVYYDGEAWDTVFNGSAYEVDLSDDSAATFDVSKITAAYGATNVPANQVHVTLTRADGSAATASDLEAPGTVYVDVEVYYTDANGDIVAQQESLKVVNYYGVRESADVFFTFDGENVEGDDTEVTYTGEDFTDKMGVQVFAGDRQLVEGADYTVTFEKMQADGKWAEVDSIVDAGIYNVVVNPITFVYEDAGDGVFGFQVNRAQVTAVVDGLVVEREWEADHATYTNGDTFLPYTGSAQDVTFHFEDGKGNRVEIAADTYSFIVSKDGESVESEVVEPGGYDVVFDDYDVVNYDIVGGDFTVGTASSFSDIKNSDWFVGSVFQAKENGYIKGVSGTAMYAPERSISRADAVVILARMANMDDELNSLDEDEFNNEYGIYLDYTDVDQNAYYAKAIAWATKVGIAHGDTGATTFRPDDTITREEFAALLSNYAEVVGREDISVDADAVLAGANGVDTVSGWARDAVAWAYENGVMGNNGASLNAQGDITRAETAAMAVNYQEDPLQK